MEGILMKPYNYTMGIVGFIVAGTTAKSLTDSFNRKLTVRIKLTLFRQ